MTDAQPTTAGRMPDFLYIGAPKCASTWIYHSLRAHPEIYLPPAKEIFYFDREHHRGLDWYKSFFASADRLYVGDISTSYLYSAEAAERIRQTLPAAKLIACVRNPLTRVWSEYLYKKRNAQTSADFDEALAENPRWLQWSLYSEHVARYQQLFGADQFRVFVYDDLQSDPVEFGRSVFAFLGVDSQFENPYVKRKVLAASKPRSRAVAALAKQAARTARKLGFAGVVGRAKGSGLLASMLYVPLVESTAERMPADERQRLAAYFVDDVDRLSSLLNRDLRCWLAPPTEGTS